MKRIISLVLVLIVFLCACSNPASDDEAQPVYLPETQSSEISLYTDGSAQPFLAQSYEDKHIVALVYDGLFAIDNDYSLKPLLADSYYLSDNTLTVTLKSGLTFSDGTVFNSTALIDALSRVRGDRYAPLTDAIAETAIISPVCVQLTLSSVPSNLLPTLTFPVVNAAGNGIGAYKFADASTLVPNENYYAGGATLSKIHLVTGDKTSLFNSGELSFIYNDGSVSQGDLGRAFTVKTVSVNELTFLGLNKNKRIFSKPEYRKALSCITDRTYLASFSPQGNGFVSFSVINPVWYRYDHSLISAKYSEAEATEMLSDVMKNASVKIVVNSENINRVMIARNLSETLETLGAVCTVSSLAWDDYIAAVNAGSYDIYVGETRLPESMSVSALLPDYSAYPDPAELIAVLDEDMPVIPLFFDQHTLFSGGAVLSEDEPYLTVIGYK